MVPLQMYYFFLRVQTPNVLHNGLEANDEIIYYN